MKSFLILLVISLCATIVPPALAEDRAPPTRPETIKVPPEASPIPASTPKTEKTQAKSKEESRRIGPFKALTFDESVLQEVVYRKEDNTVWLRLRPEVRHKEIVVKISNQKFANYRKWLDRDGYEMVSPGNAGKQPNALTDWLQTRAPYIEYYMDGELFLHLKREEF